MNHLIIIFIIDFKTETKGKVQIKKILSTASEQFC